MNCNADKIVPYRFGLGTDKEMSTNGDANKITILLKEMGINMENKKIQAIYTTK
jgi:hypothetical protein